MSKLLFSILPFLLGDGEQSLHKLSQTILGQKRKMACRRSGTYVVFFSVKDLETIGLLICVWQRPRILVLFQYRDKKWFPFESSVLFSSTTEDMWSMGCFRSGILHVCLQGFSRGIAFVNQQEPYQYEKGTYPPLYSQQVLEKHPTNQCTGYKVGGSVYDSSFQWGWTQLQGLGETCPHQDITHKYQSKTNNLHIQFQLTTQRNMHKHLAAMLEDNVVECQFGKDRA